MADVKTQANNDLVESFLHSVQPEKRRSDALELLDNMREWTGYPGRLWGSSIVGFGSYHYVYESGREGDWMLTGFSPRKQNLTVYIMPGFQPFQDLLSQLGPYKLGKSCLYLKGLETVDINVLKKLVCESVALMKNKYNIA
ncbi:MAG: DUF1801 domain-containing protein [Acidobacteria bacterium]|nr:DUF1801 domain-containing protein [Acidobacteriota bacterium]